MAAKTNDTEKIFLDANKQHRVWHKFSNWISKTYGKDLWGKEVVNVITDEKGKKHKIKYKNFNELELSRRLVGYKVMCRIKNYVRRYCPEIKIVHCDDSVYAGSDILLIPHPEHGITMIFIPQCTNVQNEFFLYYGHYKNLMKELAAMKYVYKKEIKQIKVLNKPQNKKVKCKKKNIAS